jgi:hypothetical protein
VASEPQIAANRRNGRKSTGPRSRGGKKRVSGNAYRHGLTLSIGSSTAFAKQLEQLARKIAGDTKDEVILQYARAVAQAELDLARVRRAKVALIQRVSALGALVDEGPEILAGSVREHIRFLKAVLRGEAALPEPINPAATMPPKEPERSAEAVRRVLPELIKLDRYERRASTRRDQAVRDIATGRIKIL